MPDSPLHKAIEQGSVRLAHGDDGSRYLVAMTDQAEPGWWTVVARDCEEISEIPCCWDFDAVSGRGRAQPCWVWSVPDDGPVTITTIGRETATLELARDGHALSL